MIAGKEVACDGGKPAFFGTCVQPAKMNILLVGCFTTHARQLLYSHNCGGVTEICVVQFRREVETVHTLVGRKNQDGARIISSPKTARSIEDDELLAEAILHMPRIPLSFRKIDKRNICLCYESPEV